MRLLSLLIGLVIIGYWIFNAIEKRRNIKRSKEAEKLEDIVLESTKSLSALEDPLLEEVVQEKEMREPDSAFIAFTILPKGKSAFSGLSVSMALQKHQFFFGKQDLFHRHVDDNPELAVLYSIASIIEPGTFLNRKLLNQSIPGIILFMLIPPETDLTESFEKMLTSARQLSATLNGELCDAKRRLLSLQEIERCRKMVKENRELALSRRDIKGGK